VRLHFAPRFPLPPLCATACAPPSLCTSSCLLYILQHACIFAALLRFFSLLAPYERNASRRKRGIKKKKSSGSGARRAAAPLLPLTAGAARKTHAYHIWLSCTGDAALPGSFTFSAFHGSRLHLSLRDGWLGSLTRLRAAFPAVYAAISGCAFHHTYSALFCRREKWTPALCSPTTRARWRLAPGLRPS